MTTIIAGRFDEQEKVQRVIGKLRAQGFTANAIDTFFVNPPGQHDATPIGWDRDESAGATRADTSAVEGSGIGGAAGVVAGLAAAPFAGPAAVAVGVGVGAYLGSLGGALRGMADGNEHADDRYVPRARHGGLLVAIAAPQPDRQLQAISTLREDGGQDIEWTEGQWINGRWADFNPLLPPRLVDHLPLPEEESGHAAA